MARVPPYTSEALNSIDSLSQDCCTSLF